ncbi:MAG TPA: hypothetical protein ENI64_04045 [Gammaproteobacteria bacterium]|nr:hypothetical protein [Gammaproteobacteria bacterium]
MNAIAIVLHLLSAVIWVGGMFFAYMILRPAAASALQPPERLTTWVQTFKRFFPWVWISVVLLPVTGYWLVFDVFHGLSTAPKSVNIMQGLGIVMILLYLHVYFSPFRRLCKAVDQADWVAGGKQLAIIRKLVAINMSLGLIVIAIASAGRYVLLS